MPDIYHGVIIKQRLTVFEAELRRHGIWAEPCNGFRSMEEQKRLYAQGRTTPGKRVTNAKPGDSPHNYGLAMDYVPVMNGKRTYNVGVGWWIKFGLAARAAKLTWGGSWKKLIDRPHVELPNWRKSI
jgi:peptidoglycan L-alanyl-D-glutamate endopeptidase CwlK